MPRAAAGLCVDDAAGIVMVVVVVVIVWRRGPGIGGRG